MARILEKSGFARRKVRQLCFQRDLIVERTRENFIAEETAVAMTEYLVLLGLLIGGTIGAIIYVAQELGLAFSSWGDFWTSI